MAPSDRATASPLLTPKPAAPAVVNKLVAALTSLKLAFGLGCLLMPRLTTAALLLDAPAAQAVVVTRLYGGAVTALGGLLWMVARHDTGPGEASVRRLLKDTLAVHIVADTVDVISCGVGFVTGALRMPVFGVAGGGCAALAALGLAAYKSVVLED